MLTAVLIDDHPLLGLGLQAGLAAHGIKLTVFEPSETDLLMPKVAASNPSLAVVDLSMPTDGGGMGLIRPLVDRDIVVAVLTGEQDQLLWAQALVEGATVVLSKSESIEDLLIALDRTCRGEIVRPHQRNELADAIVQYQATTEKLLAPFQALTAREQAVLGGLMDGRTLNDIAEVCYVSVHTVRTQAKSVLKKLNVHSQVEAVALARKAGWDCPSEASA